MKKLLSINQQYYPQFEELFIISDLHLGGPPGFQIFNAGAHLEKLVDHLRNVAPKKKVALLVNGDLVDFLAERPAMHFDPAGAIEKLDRIIADPGFTGVWTALQNFVSVKNRFLIINLGNHDLELALPWVREHLLQILAAGNEAARGRITLVFDGAGFLCRVGPARVLCVHGNEVDEWNIADYETIRRIGRDLVQGRPVDTWIPNAGTQLVIDIMNEIKGRYPFVDLLKPEMQAVIPTLLALAPEQQEKISAISATARRLFWDKLKIATGFLGKEEEKQPASRLLQADIIPDFPADYYFMEDSKIAPDNNQIYAEALLAETENRLHQNVDPVSLLKDSLREQNLGLPGAIIKIFRGEEKSEILREALEKLQEDRSFELNAEDETYKRLDERVGEEINFVVAGHTHLERALPRKKGTGYYYNSGTWVRLIKLEEPVLKNKETFKKVFEAFQAGTIEALDIFKPVEKKELVMRRLTVVVINTDGHKTFGKLQHVNLQLSGELLTDVRDSHFTYPK